MIPNHLPKLNKEEVTAATKSIKQLDLQVVSVDEIKELLDPLFTGLIRGVPNFQPGMALFSGYISPKPLEIAVDTALAAASSKEGRANRDGVQMLYCGTSRQAAIFELEPEVGDTVVIVHWITVAPLLVNHVGYTSQAFVSLGSNRKVPMWDNNPPAIAREHQEIEDFLADRFTSIVPSSERDLHRKLTVAIAERLAEDEKFDGLIYPAVTMRANGDVIALKHRHAEQKLKFLKAELIQINGVSELSYAATVIDTALDISDDGTIGWLSMTREDRTQLAERYGTFGWRQFLEQKQGIFHNYDTAKIHASDQSVPTEHGRVAEASLRRWLERYLPQKYGVTSGYIIPDVRRLDYILRHYDVIVFDKLNSPVLWASANPDDSDLGAKRAIPAQHVIAVFEVKSTFTRASINDAKKKLKELNDYQTHLPAHFMSSIVFFELMIKEQSKCVLAEHLFDDTIPGYFGGIILRAEGFDENLSGYYLMEVNDPDTVKTMPLIREIGTLQRDEHGNPQATEQGDTIIAFSGDGVWHFDKGYSPVVQNVQLTWSYNSFPRFCIDLLERLEGEFDPALAAKHGAYGMSFLR